MWGVGWTELEIDVLPKLEELLILIQKTILLDIKVLSCQCQDRLVDKQILQSFPFKTNTFSG